MRIAVRAIINHCSRKLQILSFYTLISRLLSSVGDPRHSFSLDLMHYMTPTTVLFGWILLFLARTMILRFLKSLLRILN